MYSVHVYERTNKFGLHEVGINEGGPQHLTLQQAQQIKDRVKASQLDRSRRGVPQLKYRTLFFFMLNLVEEETKAEVA